MSELLRYGELRIQNSSEFSIITPMDVQSPGPGLGSALGAEVPPSPPKPS